MLCGKAAIRIAYSTSDTCKDESQLQISPQQRKPCPSSQQTHHQNNTAIFVLFNYPFLTTQDNLPFVNHLYIAFILVPRLCLGNILREAPAS